MSLQAEGTPEDTRADLVIVLDCTFSMEPVIEVCRDFLARYLIRSGLASGIENIGLVAYGDHPGIRGEVPGWTSPILFSGLTSNLEEFVSWLHKTIESFRAVEVFSGTWPSWWEGLDFPECSPCAIAEARRLSPDCSVWVITDAPSHVEGRNFRCPNLSIEKQQELLSGAKFIITPTFSISEDDLSDNLVYPEFEHTVKHYQTFSPFVLKALNLTETFSSDEPIFEDSDEDSGYKSLQTATRSGYR